MLTEQELEMPFWQAVLDAPQPMSADDARLLLYKLGWSQEYAAKRLGTSLRQMQRYLGHNGVVPAAKAELLRRVAKEQGK